MRPLRIRKIFSCNIFLSILFFQMANALPLPSTPTDPSLPPAIPPSIPTAPTGKADAFVKLTCRGITTPSKTNVAYTDLLTVYFPAKSFLKYPSLFTLRNANPERFNYITKECNRLRYANTTFPTGRPPVWPDWGNDRKYQRIDIGEEFIPAAQKNRAMGVACEVHSQCASLYCEPNTNTCAREIE